MSEKKSYQSWTISDEFWERIKEDIPKRERDPRKKYVHGSGQGRKPMSARKALEHGYTPHIRPRGEEKKELEHNPEFHACRWVVEVTHSFLNRFRKLLVRFEKKSANYLALIQFACAVIVWHKILHVHR